MDVHVGGWARMRTECDSCLSCKQSPTQPTPYPIVQLAFVRTQLAPGADEAEEEEAEDEMAETEVGLWDDASSERPPEVVEAHAAAVLRALLHGQPLPAAAAASSSSASSSLRGGRSRNGGGSAASLLLQGQYAEGEGSRPTRDVENEAQDGEGESVAGASHRRGALKRR